MNTDSWIIVTEAGRLGGMVAAARGLGGTVIAAVVGPRALADAAAASGPDRAVWFPAEDGRPPEAYAPQLAEAIKAANPRLVIASDAPSGRILLGFAAAALKAAVIASMRTICAQGDKLLATRPVADGRAMETLEVAGSLACIFDGDDVEQAGAPAPTVETAQVADPGAAMRITETQAAGADSAGLLSAARVVGVGLGLRAKDDLKLVEELAASIGAEVACSLPVCDDMRWYGASRVVGSSHNRIAPDLYIAVGVSGQPQHMTGVRDAKLVVAVNNDPEARIFKNCDYGVLGDLYKIVPALTAAFKNV